MRSQCEIGNNRILDVIITKEDIEGKIFFIAQGIQIDVASQGLSLEEALENIKDAAEIVLDNTQEEPAIIFREENQFAPMLTRMTI